MKLTMKFVTQSAILALVVLLLPSVTLAQYVQTDLVSSTGVGQSPADPNLVNGWGLVSLAFSPFWVSDNGTGKSTLYTRLANQSRSMTFGRSSSARTAGRTAPITNCSSLPDRTIMPTVYLA